MTKDEEHVIDCPRCGHCCPQPEQEPVCAHGIEKTKCSFCHQPEQKPVAWMTPTGALYRTEDVDGCFDDKHIPLYTTPPHRKPLTDEEIGRIAGETLDPWSCARAIEAAHGIKE